MNKLIAFNFYSLYLFKCKCIIVGNFPAFRKCLLDIFFALSFQNIFKVFKTGLYYILFAIIFQIPINLYSQNTYRIEQDPLGNTWVFPPKSKILFDDINVKNKSRYHYILIDSLRGDYNHVLKYLNKAKYYRSWESIQDNCFDIECYGRDSNLEQLLVNCLNAENEIESRSDNHKQNSKLLPLAVRKPSKEIISQIKKKQDSKSNLSIEGCFDNLCPKSVGDFAFIKYSCDSAALFLQVDYKGIITDPKHNLHQFVIDLFLELSSREGESAFNWPMSISADLIEIIVSMLPVPSDQSLLQYLSYSGDEMSYMLLTPRTFLQVDNIIKQADESNPNKWFYSLVGSGIHHMIKEENGLPLWAPFYRFHIATGLPNNLIDENNGNILLASTADIQFSSETSTFRHVFLFMDRFKRNNSSSSIGNTDCFNEDLFSVCNSNLLHYDKPQDAFFKSNSIWQLDADKAIISSFGPRNLIQPKFQIWINRQMHLINVSNSVFDLRQTAILPDIIEYRRMYLGQYHRLLIGKQNFILLPGDQIIFK